MFLGTYQPRLDDKGRLFLPAKFRDELAGGLVITKGQEHCLFVFTRAEFAGITQRMAEASFTSKAARDYSRVFFAGASDEVPDRQGRITVPAALRSYAGLDKDCVVIGANTRLEIWDAQAWESYLQTRSRPSPSCPRRCSRVWADPHDEDARRGLLPPECFPGRFLAHLPRCQASTAPSPSRAGGDLATRP